METCANKSLESLGYNPMLEVLLFITVQVKIPATFYSAWYAMQLLVKQSILYSSFYSIATRELVDFTREGTVLLNFCIAH